MRGVEIAVKALVSGQALLLGMAPQKEKEKKEKKKKKEKKEPAREEGESSEDKTIPSPKPAEPAKESKAKESKETDEKETDEKKEEGHSSHEESYSTDKAAKAADLRKKALAELYQQKPAEPAEPPKSRPAVSLHSGGERQVCKPGCQQAPQADAREPSPEGNLHLPALRHVHRAQPAGLEGPSPRREVPSIQELECWHSTVASLPGHGGDTACGVGSWRAGRLPGARGAAGPSCQACAHLQVAKQADATRASLAPHGLQVLWPLRGTRSQEAEARREEIRAAT